MGTGARPARRRGVAGPRSNLAVCARHRERSETCLLESGLPPDQGPPRHPRLFDLRVSARLRFQDIIDLREAVIDAAWL